jgi:hypothetical protein
MTSPTPPTSTALATRFSIDTRPTPANSSPNDRPSSDRAAPLKPSDHPFPGPSLSQYDRNLPSFSPCDRQTASPSQDFRQSFSLCDRPFSGSDFGPCDRPPLPKCKTLSLRQGSAKRSACLPPSQKSLSLARPSRILQRYDLGFLWGLWLRVAVQNMIRNSPQRMPSAERSWIPSCPTPAAGAVT